MDIKSREQFETDVLNGIPGRAYVVDFWAEWCAPCRALGPVLERVVARMGGDAELVKVNIDLLPALAQAYRVQSIPLVLGIRDGKPVGEFLGAFPEATVEAHIRKWVLTEAERVAAQALELLGTGDAAQAQAALAPALDKEPMSTVARAAMGRIELALGQIDDAARRLSDLISDTGPTAELEGLLARAQFAIRARDSGGEEAARERVERNPADFDARHDLASAQASREQYREALETLLESVKRNRTYNREEARKSMLGIFKLLGDAHPLVDEFRSRLSKVIFS